MADFPLTDSARWVLSQTDDEFVEQDWPAVRKILAANDLAALKRRPSDLRRYIKWTADTKAQYGTISNFLIAHRLPKAWGQPPYTPVSATLFADPRDYQVLRNDWPYGLAPEITHLVVWTRTRISTDPATGDLTPASRALIADFVQRFFADRLDGPVEHGNENSNVLWFKNWAQLQTVPQLEHIHVLVRNASPELLQSWTAEMGHAA